MKTRQKGMETYMFEITEDVLPAGIKPGTFKE
jgi:hypothetical protein